MKIRSGLLICGAILAALPASAAAQATAEPKVTLAESAKPNSNVSIAVEPALSDGRLIVKIAVQNRSAAPVAFGPGNVAIAKAKGEAIAVTPLARLIDEVNVAAGAPAASAHASGSAYSAPIMPVNSEGQTDVSGYTGGMAVAPDENVRRSRQSRPGSQPAITREEADKQIGALKAAILQDQTLQPRQIAAGQIVSEPLNFGKGESRLIHLWVRVAGDEHSFTLAAPK